MTVELRCQEEVLVKNKGGVIEAEATKQCSICISLRVGLKINSPSYQSCF